MMYYKMKQKKQTFDILFLSVVFYFKGISENIRYANREYFLVYVIN